MIDLLDRQHWHEWDHPEVSTSPLEVQRHRGFTVGMMYGWPEENTPDFSQYEGIKSTANKETASDIQEPQPLPTGTVKTKLATYKKAIMNGTGKKRDHVRGGVSCLFDFAEEAGTGFDRNHIPATKIDLYEFLQENIPWLLAGYTKKGFKSALEKKRGDSERIGTFASHSNKHFWQEILGDIKY